LCQFSLQLYENRSCLEIPSKISPLKDLVASGVPPLRGSALSLLLPGTAVPGFMCRRSAAELLFAISFATADCRCQINPLSDHF
jgi:hypothetical protein